MHIHNKKSILRYLLNPFKSSRGQSLAEFAVITAMMATFIATAIPKFSDVMESGKAGKSIDEIDKILLQAKNFYETTAALEGRGRLPGQDKFDMVVGGYTDSTDLLDDLLLFDSYSDTVLGRSGFQFLEQTILRLSCHLAPILWMIRCLLM